MLEAAAWGLFAGSSLIVGAVLSLVLRPPAMLVGLIMAFGAGALISAVSYDLIGEAIADDASMEIAVFMLIGAMVYVAGDWLIERGGGSEQHAGKVTDRPAEGRGMSIVLGTILDGIPESVVLGLSFIGGGSVSVSLIAAVFMSNLPEALGATSSLTRSGWSAANVLLLWTSIALVSALAAGLGYAYFDALPSNTGVRANAFAAGAILAMLTDTMVPESFREGGRFAGIVTVLGFVVGVALTAAN
jgi:ZIP family zinc transporter